MCMVYNMTLSMQNYYHDKAIAISPRIALVYITFPAKLQDLAPPQDKNGKHDQTPQVRNILQSLTNIDIQNHGHLVII